MATIIIALSGNAAADAKGPHPSEPLAKYAQPQTLVTVQGTRRLNVVCMGEGSPLVILESGAGDSAAVWRLVQGKVAERTRVCAYDRAGYGYSDPPTAAVDAEQTTTDLKRLLGQIGDGSPAVLVGHSLGGPYVEHFAGTYPSDVAGVVLVDPTGLDDFRYVRDMLSTWPGEQARNKVNWQKRMELYRRCTRLALTGELRNAPPPECINSGAEDPGLAYALASRWAAGTNWPTFLAEMDSFYPANHPMGVDGRTTSQVRRRPMKLGRKPLILLMTPGNVPPGERGERLRAKSRETAERLVAQASSNGRVVPVPGGHYVQLDHPDLVVDAINEVIERVRNRAGH